MVSSSDSLPMRDLYGWYFVSLSFVDIDLVTFPQNPGDYCFGSIVLRPMVMVHQPKISPIVSLYSVRWISPAQISFAFNFSELIRDEYLRALPSN